MRNARARIAVQLMRWPPAYLWGRRVLIFLRFVVRRPHDRDFMAFATTPDEGLFLDVGANSGMSALSFRIYNRRMPILSIEANPFHAPDLGFLKHWLRAFDFRIVGAGERAEALRLHVPVFRGVALTGEASVLGRRSDDLEWWAEQHLGPRARPEFELRAVDVGVIPLDDLNLTPSIVKIDVEGFELQVLHGLARTIARSHPLFLIEAPPDLSPLSDWLARWGYRPYSFDARRRCLVPYRTSGNNAFFVSADGPATGITVPRDDRRLPEYDLP
jgi:FkbM family methyltransferase